MVLYKTIEWFYIELCHGLDRNIKRRYGAGIHRKGLPRSNNASAAPGAKHSPPHR